MLSIKVLGPGCANCNNVEAIAKRVVASLSLDATVTKVTDPAAWRKYGLLYTPGLVVDEKLVCGGRVPSEAEVATWITNALV